jgi:cytochrome c-type biogenesis protein
MEPFLQSVLDNTTAPLLYAFILGLMTAISPCPLATNITAIGYLSRNLEHKKRALLHGIYYTLGRAISYTVLGLVLYFGASKFHIAHLLQQNGEKLLGPVLLIIGIFMLGVIKIHLSLLDRIFNRFTPEGNSTSAWSALLMGILFALAFCPYSGVLYFGMLIPMTISSADGLYLPVIFAFATGLPVILFAYLIAYMVSGIGTVYNKLKTFEMYFRYVVASLFIITGIYYLYIFYIA